jgi:DNA-binding transcriptional LysR family regulator
MELHHLRYFEAVARHGHVTRAARELSIAQPSLSKQIQVLESELDVKLFNRVGRRIELSEAGHVLLPYARRILHDVEHARTALQQIGDLTRGHVSLGASPTVGTQLLPRALAEFTRQYPGIELELREAGAARLVALLEEGSVQLVVVSLALLGQHSRLARAELFTEDLVLAVAPHHSLAERSSVPARDLRDEKFILFPSGYELRALTTQLCQAGGFEPRVAIDGAEMDSVLRFAAAGLGIALVPRLALAQAEGLTAVLVEDVPLTRTLGLVWHSERQLSPAARAVQQFLLQRLQAPKPQVTSVDEQQAG